jgi:ubiquinone biosynthesis protein
MPRPFQRIRHLNRYREITLTFVRHGFGDFVRRLGLFERLSLRRREVLQEVREEETFDLDSAVRVRLVFEELGPTFIKLGQILSTRPDIVPPEIIVELEKLQDEAPPVEWEVAKTCLEQELGGPLHNFYQFVESVPLASASLGQVHGARLWDGRDVVVKVQRPNIQRLIEIDLEILQDVAYLMQSFTPLGRIYDLPAIAEDFAETLRTELDYQLEGQHADYFRENFVDDPDVYIPEIYWEFTTNKVLTMERLYGIKVDDVERLDNAGYDRHEIALKSARLIIKEVLEDGFFHADPHPGNLFVMKGEVIGVMDFGMVGWLDNRTRLQVAQLYIVSVRRDIDGIVDRLIQLGVARQDANRMQLRRDLNRLLRKYYGRRLKEVRANELIQDVLPIIYRHRLQMPTDLWLLLKTLAIMEGVGRRLDPEFDMFSASKPFVKRLSRSLWSPRTWRDSLMRSSAGFTDLMVSAPEISLSVLRRLDRGQIKLMIEPTGLNDLFSRVDVLVNRLSISIVLAAVTLGLALVIPELDNAPTWLSIYLVLLFVFVTGLGAWLAFSMLRGNRPR